MAIEWREKWAFGDDRVDAEHIEILLLVNQVLIALEERAARPAVSTLIQALIKRAEAHFSYEEHLMSDAEYEDSEAHHDEHQMLISTLYIMVSDLLVSAISDDNSVIGRYIEHWFIDHLEKDDAELSAFLLSR